MPSYPPSEYSTSSGTDEGRHVSPNPRPIQRSSYWTRPTVRKTNENVDDNRKKLALDGDYLYYKNKLMKKSPNSSSTPKKAASSTASVSTFSAGQDIPYSGLRKSEFGRSATKDVGWLWLGRKVGPNSSMVVVKKKSKPKTSGK